MISSLRSPAERHHWVHRSHRRVRRPVRGRPGVRRLRPPLLRAAPADPRRHSGAQRTDPARTPRPRTPEPAAPASELCAFGCIVRAAKLRCGSSAPADGLRRSVLPTSPFPLPHSASSVIFHPLLLSRQDLDKIGQGKLKIVAEPFDVSTMIGTVLFQVAQARSYEADACSSQPAASPDIPSREIYHVEEETVLKAFVLSISGTGGPREGPGDLCRHRAAAAAACARRRRAHAPTRRAPTVHPPCTHPPCLP